MKCQKCNIGNLVLQKNQNKNQLNNLFYICTNCGEEFVENETSKKIRLQKNH